MSYFSIWAKVAPPQILTLGLTSRVAAEVAEDMRRLADAAGGRLAPPGASGALAAAPVLDFLSKEEDAEEGAGRRAGAAAAAPLGRVLGAAATVGLAALVAGCHEGAPWCTGAGGGPNEEEKQTERKNDK